MYYYQCRFNPYALTLQIAFEFRTPRSPLIQMVNIIERDKTNKLS